MLEYRSQAIEKCVVVIGRRRARQGGFTLMEGLIASVVLAILVLGVCSTLATSYQQAIIVKNNAAGIILARQLADEITSKPLADPNTGSTALGPDTGMTTRSTFTRVTNYSGYSDTSTSMPLMAGGTLDVTGSDLYSRSVNVVVGAKPSIDTASPTTDFSIVTVQVTGPDGQTVGIPKFVAKYAIQR